MAVMWPREIPLSVRQDRRRHAEVRVYNRLADTLDDKHSVFYSSPWLGIDRLGVERDGECDFLVAHPELGILAIEVKGGAISFDAGEGQWWSTDAQGFRHRIKDPVEQARRAKYQMLEKLKGSGRWIEKWIRTSHGVIFPDASRVPRDLGADKPARIFCCAGQLKTGFGEWIESRMRGAGGEDTYQQLGADGISALEHILAQPFQLSFTVSAAMADALERLKVLEPSQYHILDHIRDINRALISGGAGTGKTVLAMEEAVRCSSAGMRTLLTCHGRPLAIEMARRLAYIDNLTIGNFHVICIEVAKAAGLTVPQRMDERKFFDETLPSLMLDATYGNPECKWERIIVDEAQDFHENWWLAIASAVADDGGIRAFMDSNQSVYSGRHAPELGLELVPIRLNRNLRNTRLIHDAAAIHYGGPEILAEGPDGPDVCWIEAETRSEMIAAAYRKLRQLVFSDEVAPDDVAVICPDAGWVDEFAGHASRFEPGFDNCEDMSTERVVLDTVRRFKGLERPAVIALIASSDMLAGEMAYVAFSRPRTYLAVVASRSDLAWLK